MIEYKVKMILETQYKKKGTKHVFWTATTEVKIIDRREYEKLTCNETVRFFRAVGTQESRVFGYTPHGYQVTKLTSTTKDKKTRLIRKFKFDI